MIFVYLKPGKEKSLHRRHPWVYGTAIASVKGSPWVGETVQLRSHDNQPLGFGAFSPDSQIRVRMWCFDPALTIDADFISARIAQAIALRNSLQQRTSAIRLIFGEADQLPGLVVDRYDQTLVVQFLAAGVEFWRETIVEALQQHTGCTQIYERSDAAVREREGLPKRTGILRGVEPADVQVLEDGVRYHVNVQQGHKTGFYIDQRENRKLVADLVRKIGPHATALNCFCYTGGFSLAALGAGAAQVVSVDSSGDALAQGQRNLVLNSFDPNRAQWRDENVFDTLKHLAAAEQRFDLIVLDPPKFAPSAQHVDRAARAYKEINLKGMRLLNPGGYLLTFSCSGAINVELFQKIVAGAVIDSGMPMQLLQRLAAGHDHPMLMTHPEGEYLKGLLLQRVD